jgi:CRISPR-associated protein Csx10
VALRDDKLEPATSTEALHRELETRQGVRLEPVSGGARLRAGRIDAWQAAWGLPRPSVVAIAAGSVVSFTTSEGIDEARLAEVALAGIGERRAEGLGEVVFQHPLADVERHWDGVPFRRPPADKEDGSTPNGPIAPADERFLRVVERELWRDRIRTLAVTRAADSRFRQDILGWRDDLAGSQRGALREVVRRSPAPGPDSPASAWLRRLEEVEARAEKWRRTGGPDALKVLERLFTGPEEVWHLLFDGGAPATPHEGELRTELWQEAVTLLIDECARRHGGDRRG